MSRKKFAPLQCIEGSQTITREFLSNLEHALLLALLEDGTLTQMQYRQAYEKWKKQKRLLLEEKLAPKATDVVGGTALSNAGPFGEFVLRHHHIRPCGAPSPQGEGLIGKEEP